MNIEPWPLTYTPYEGLNLCNQISLRLEVFDRKLEGSHSIFYIYYNIYQSNEALVLKNTVFQLINLKNCQIITHYLKVTDKEATLKQTWWNLPRRYFSPGGRVDGVLAHVLAEVLRCGL